MSASSKSTARATYMNNFVTPLGEFCPNHISDLATWLAQSEITRLRLKLILTSTGIYVGGS